MRMASLVCTEKCIFEFPFQNTDKTIGFPSLLAHHTSLQLINPIFSIPKCAGTKIIPKQTTFSPLHSELSCDIHFLNLRTMQNSDDGVNRLVPRDTAGLYFHRLGVDCGFPNRGLSCNIANGEVTILVFCRFQSEFGWYTF